jgi:hypothetical protein
MSKIYLNHDNVWLYAATVHDKNTKYHVDFRIYFDLNDSGNRLDADLKIRETINSVEDIYNQMLSAIFPDEEKPKSLETNQITTITFESIVKVAEGFEIKRLGISEAEYNKLETLPDNSNKVSQRLLDLVISRKHGNQVFAKDSIQIFWFRTFNGEPFDSDDEAMLYDICKSYVVDEAVYLSL